MSLTHLSQVCVLWPFVGNNNQGEPQVGQPIEIPCRWEDRRSQTVDVKGTPIATDVIVYVDRVIDQGSILWRGQLARWQNTGNQRLVRVAYYEEIPTVDGTNCEQSVHGMRYMGVLPEVRL